ncbi:MAG TPA: hypothetical protein VLW83_04055 [Candidatus Acidoferrales bacterium]|jgi:hypothetical protein|nr:hypothetical protein [Candidatus Acidoferrales bacterium]
MPKRPRKKSAAKKSSHAKSARSKSSAKGAVKNSSPNSLATFAALRAILSEFDGKLRVSRDEPGKYELVSLEPTFRGRPMYFGSVLIQKNYVSFHLMPIYACPGLERDLSPELRKHKQGKSCFNFTEPDLLLFVQLAALTVSGYRAFQQRGWV